MLTTKNRRKTLGGAIGRLIGGMAAITIIAWIARAGSLTSCRRGRR